MSGKKEYDLIFSLGEACSSTQTLRNSKLQIFSYPLDWLFGADFIRRCEILTSKFEHFIEMKDLEYIYTERSISCDAYHNKHNGLTFNHDFLKDKNLSETYPAVKEKYDRRIKRLYNAIEKSKKILIVFLEIPNNPKKLIDDSILVTNLQKIKNLYPDKEFNLLYFSNDSTMQEKQYMENYITNEIIKVIGNYKDMKEGMPDYAVDCKFFKQYYSKYSLKTTLKYKVKRFLITIFIKLIPIKSLRRSLKIKYHV